MLATWTGAKAGASCTTTRAPFARSITRRSSAVIVFHGVAGAAATMWLGVSIFFAGAAPRSKAAAGASRKVGFILPLYPGLGRGPVPGSCLRTNTVRPADVPHDFDAFGLGRARPGIRH